MEKLWLLNPDKKNEFARIITTRFLQWGKFSTNIYIKKLYIYFFEFFVILICKNY